MMRLEPIEKPNNLMLWMGYRMMEREYGKVLTPLKIIYARKPSLMFIAQRIDKTANKNISFEAPFRLLIQVFASMTNGCSFCYDFRQTQATKRHLGSEKFKALGNYGRSEIFSQRERAALAYVEQVVNDKRVSEETFAELKNQFTETEIIELTWLIAAENYYNTLMIPLGIESDDLCKVAEERIKH